mgnify:CR=1 FL=1
MTPNEPAVSPGLPVVDAAIDPDLLERPDQVLRREVWPGLEVMVAVSLGGALGALGRYGLAQAVATDGLGVPWATLIANVGGSLLLGVLTAVAIARFPDHQYLRPFLGVGVLGSFAVELDTRLGQTHLATALGYGLLSVMLGVAAAAVGLWLGRTAVRDE